MRPSRSDTFFTLVLIGKIGIYDFVKGAPAKGVRGAIAKPPDMSLEAMN